MSDMTPEPLDLAALLASIDEAVYGPAAPAIRATLERVAEHRGWFPPQQVVEVPAEARGWAAEHLSRLAGWTRNGVDVPGPDSVRWIVGELDVFDRLAEGRADTEGWGDPWGQEEWGGLLVGLNDERVARLEASPDLLRLVQPPLWPLPEMPKVIRSLLTEPGPPEPIYQSEPRWAMLSHVEYNLWRVLEWAVSERGDLSTCPFEPLLRLHLAGWYPIGFRGGWLVVYGRQGTAPAAGDS